MSLSLRLKRLKQRFHLLPPLGDSDVKAVVRHRDGYLCTECGMTARQHLKRFGRTLEVHRIVPGSDYTVHGCQTLCQICHDSKPTSPPGSGRFARHKVPVPGRLVDQFRRLAELQRRPLRSVVLSAILQHIKRFKEGEDAHLLSWSDHMPKPAAARPAMWALLFRSVDEAEASDPELRMILRYALRKMGQRFLGLTKLPVCSDNGPGMIRLPSPR